MQIVASLKANRGRHWPMRSNTPYLLLYHFCPFSPATSLLYFAPFTRKQFKTLQRPLTWMQLDSEQQLHVAFPEQRVALLKAWFLEFCPRKVASYFPMQKDLTAWLFVLRVAESLLTRPRLILCRHLQEVLWCRIETLSFATAVENKADFSVFFLSKGKNSWCGIYWNLVLI